METARRDGLWDSLKQAVLSGPSTSILPFIEAAFLGLFFEPARAIGVWLQTIWLGALGLSIFFYFRKFNGSNLWLAIAFTLPFLGIAAIWQYNGGLSDFRMDLHLYLLMGTSFIWFLATYCTDKLYPWLICGAFIGLTCLARTYAPAYYLITLVPLVAIRFIKPEKISRLTLAKNYLFLILTAVLVCGWCYIAIFNQVYQYYFFNPADPQAHLPLHRSIKHVFLTIRNIGWFPIVFVAALLPFNVKYFFKQHNAFSFWKRINWKVLWLGLAPVLFLVVHGAGLNPYVSMPAVLGLILFAIHPFKVQVHDVYQSFQTSYIKFLIPLLAITLFCVAAIQSVQLHLNATGGRARWLELNNAMPPSQEILKAIIDDANLHNSSPTNFTTSYLSVINDETLQNIFIFDIDLKRKHIDPGLFNRLSKTSVFYKVSDGEWSNIPGNSDQDKVDYLVQTANESVDYLVIPTRETARFVEKRITRNISSNTQAQEIRDALLRSRNWIAVSDLIKVSKHETVAVYRNGQRVQ
ncbi:MAG TPA: hypothetical protein DEV81_24885 [Cyanobacteria bacterium UBA11049]|nr:hypothetical protein [Cyanobacteria bacterium UBA11049]